MPRNRDDTEPDAHRLRCPECKQDKDFLHGQWVKISYPVCIYEDGALELEGGFNVDWDTAQDASTPFTCQRCGHQFSDREVEWA